MRENICEIEGAPYCEEHYCAMQGLFCNRCSKVITTNPYVTTGEQKFHQACFSCNSCGRPLESSYQLRAGEGGEDFGGIYCRVCVK